MPRNAQMKNRKTFLEIGDTVGHGEQPVEHGKQSVEHVEQPVEHVLDG